MNECPLSDFHQLYQLNLSIFNQKYKVILKIHLILIKLRLKEGQLIKKLQDLILFIALLN